MNVIVSPESAIDIQADCLIHFTTEARSIKDPFLKSINKATDGAVRALFNTEEFTGREGQLSTLYPVPGFKARRIILVGLGQAKNVDSDCYRRAMGQASRFKTVTSSKKVAVSFGKNEKPEFFQAVVEGCLLGKYKILKFKSGEAKTDKHQLASLICLVSRKSLVSQTKKATSRGQIIAEGQILARDLSFTPANYLTPVKFAGLANAQAKKHGFSFKALGQAAIEKEKMGAYLSVTKGSTEPPRFMIMQYKGAAASQKPICLIGKGVTFDTGGISLKAGLNMHEMKQDMTGAAVVLATIVTAARLRIKQNIVALIAACENMPAGDATKPGDVVTARNGMTIEIINTDAEGRLTLADALDYANKFKPQAVIDIATLTGAALFVLGYAGAPITGNNTKLLGLIEESSFGLGERVWQMPIWDEFRDSMKSDCADLVNAGVRAAGTMCAAAFLENFIGDYPWAHIDIAYMDLEPKGRDYIPKGASGWGVRLLTEVLSNWKKV